MLVEIGVVSPLQYWQQMLVKWSNMLAIICLDVMQRAIWMKCKVRFEVLTLVLLMIQGFWDVVLHLG